MKVHIFHTGSLLLGLVSLLGLLFVVLSQFRLGAVALVLVGIPCLSALTTPAVPVGVRGYLAVPLRRELGRVPLFPPA